MVYQNWIVGDLINVCANLRVFCGLYYKGLSFYSMDVEKSGIPCNITCPPEGCTYSCPPPGPLDNINKLVSIYSCRNSKSASGGANCSDLTAKADHVYRKLGDAYTNSQGIANIVFTVLDQDLTDYQDAISQGGTYDIFACSDSANLGDIVRITQITVIPNLCAGISCNDICIGNDLYSQVCNPATGQCIQGALKEANSLRCLPATHSVDLQVSLVPAELVQYISQYIVNISDNIITWLSNYVPGFSLPPDWVYLRTEFDPVTNTFRLMMAYTGTLGLNSLGITEALAALWDKIITYKLAILSGILAIIGAALILLGFPWIALFWLLGSIVFVTVGIIQLAGENKINEQRAYNGDVKSGQTDKENGQLINIDNTWNNSGKTQSDCLARLTAVRDLHKSIINGYAEQYNGTPSIVNAMNSENTKFSSDADAIINQFNADPDYNPDKCDSYYASLRGKVDESNVRISGTIDTNAPGGSSGEYNPPILCADHKTQEECEAAGCKWDNGVCKAKDCLIPSPLGGCLLYKETAAGGAMLIGGLFLGLFILGAVLSEGKK